MITLEQLCRRIDLPPQICGRVAAADGALDHQALEPAMQMLFCRETWEQGRLMLKRHLGSDPDGIKILACMLRGACRSEARYRQLDIAPEIFDDTFHCFTRFVREHVVSYGREAFDRDWWTAHQLALQLFRLGQLEYECSTLAGRPAVSIHIPGDVRLQPDLLRASYQQARAFFAKHFPAYRDAPYFCHTWLLDPALGQVLPPGSRILAFQRSFAIGPVEYGAPDYLEWVFKNPNLPTAQLPEDTTLQRNLKRYLLAGGQIGEALGMLRENPFLD